MAHTRTSISDLLYRSPERNLLFHDYHCHQTPPIVILYSRRQTGLSILRREMEHQPELLNHLPARPRVHPRPEPVERNLHSRVFPIYPFPIGAILVHHRQDFCDVLPVNRNRFASTVTPVVGYLHPPSQGKGNNRNSTSVQSNKRGAEPFRSQLRHSVQ